MYFNVNVRQLELFTSIYTYDVVFATYQRKATDSTKVDTPRQKPSRCCENSKKIYSERSISPLSDYSLPVRPTNSEYSVASFYIGVYTVVTVQYCIHCSLSQTLYG